MLLILTASILVSSVLAQSCGARGYMSSAARLWGTENVHDAYTCGLDCQGVTQCQSYAVGGPEGCQLIAASLSSYFIANDSSPYQFYQKYSCDYSTLRVTPSLSVYTPTPTNAVCGVAGYDNGDPISFYSFNVPAYSTFGGCYLQCNDRGSACAAFAYGNGQCLLYAKNMQNDVIPDPTRPYTFYDMYCIAVFSTASSTPMEATPPPVPQRFE